MGAVRKTVQVEIDAAAGAYLGVTASARGLAWRDRLDAAAAKTAIAISQRHALPELLGACWPRAASASTRCRWRSTPRSRR
jgi:single-stranded-DNA-specific exonuclease